MVRVVVPAQLCACRQGTHFTTGCRASAVCRAVPLGGGKCCAAPTSSAGLGVPMAALFPKGEVSYGDGKAMEAEKEVKCCWLRDSGCLWGQNSWLLFYFTCCGAANLVLLSLLRWILQDTRLAHYHLCWPYCRPVTSCGHRKLSPRCVPLSGPYS